MKAEKTKGNFTCRVCGGTHINVTKKYWLSGKCGKGGKMKPTLRDEIDTSGTHYVGKLKDVMDDIREIVREAIKYTRIVGNIEKAEDDAIDKFKNLFAQVEAKAYQEGRESVLEDINKMKKRVIQKSEEEQKKMSDSDYRYYLLSQETSQSYNDALRDVNQQIKQGK